MKLQEAAKNTSTIPELQQNTVGLQAFERHAALIVPHETSVSPELAKALKSFADARIPIVFVGGLPRENVSFRNMQQDRELVDAGLREVSHAANAIQTADGTEAANRVARIIPPQLRFASGAVLPFVKRSIGATHFYLLTNPTDKATDTTVEISEAGAPELWDPWTGDVQKLSSQHKSGHVSLDVLLPPFGSELLGFSKSHLREVETAPVTWTQTKVQNVGEAGWDVDATGDSEKGIGIDLHVTMAKLTDWLNEPSMRTFSGRATYVTHITVSADDLKSANRIVLDLGEVKDAAEVKINGVAAAALVVHPFTTDVRSLLHEGDNEIEVTVVNSLTNYASTIQWPKNPANPIAHFPPISAGLLGPVLLEYQTESNPKAPSATAK